MAFEGPQLVCEGLTLLVGSDWWGECFCDILFAWESYVIFPPTVVITL